MSYVNPTASAINTIGLDGVITSLQSKFALLSWLPKVFHRAYIHREISNGRTATVPRVWISSNEWYNCLPNDNITAQAFFLPTSDETVSEFDNHVDPLMKADISLIVWCNTEKLSNHTTGPSLANEKADVLSILKNHDSVLSIQSVIDRSAKDIYREFDIFGGLISGSDQASTFTHYTMMPYAGFRVNFSVKFNYTVCLPIS